MKPRRSLLVALALVAAVGGYQLGRTRAGAAESAAAELRRAEPPAPPEHPFAARLRERYGPHKNSSDLEEWIVRDFFQDRRDGIFVDVGANHHQRGNNTYYLETMLGWSGVAVEPLTRFAEGYKQFRPRTTFVPLFVSDVADASATLYVPRNDSYQTTATGQRAFAERVGPYDATDVRTITLDLLLDRLGVARFDYLNLDIEEYEPQALRGFSITRFAPQLVGVEAHNPVRQQLLEYFSRNGYVLIGKYLDVDQDNYWFAPVGVVKDTPRQNARL